MPRLPSGANRPPLAASARGTLRLHGLAHGVRIVVSATAPDLLDIARSSAPPGLSWSSSLAADTAVDVPHYLDLTADENGSLEWSYSGAAAVGDVLDAAARQAPLALDDALDTIVSVSARERLFFHAGVVVIDDRALVLPGRSFAGKTTLVASLVETGAEYYSDEYAVIDGDGLVLPYPRPLRIRVGGVRESRPLPSPPLERAVPVGLVAHLTFDSALDGLQVEPLTPGETSLALIDNAVAAQLDPALVLQRATKVAEHAPGLSGRRGEARTAALVLVERLRARNAERNSTSNDPFAEPTPDGWGETAPDKTRSNRRPRRPGRGG